MDKSVKVEIAERSGNCEIITLAFSLDLTGWGRGRGEEEGEKYRQWKRSFHTITQHSSSNRTGQTERQWIQAADRGNEDGEGRRLSCGFEFIGKWDHKTENLIHILWFPAAGQDLRPDGRVDFGEGLEEKLEAW